MRTCMMVLIVSIITVGLYAAARFTDNSDGTVTDNTTGLVWQKCSMGQDVSDCSGTGTYYNWQSALQECQTLTLAGKSWRLPSINELKSIVDYSRDDPTINTTFFPNTMASYYWSSSTYVDDKTNAWYVWFNSGYADKEEKTYPNHYVRCVTDGP